MRRDQLEHAIRAATSILGDDAVVIIGSQSILGSVEEADLPEEVLQSMEVDVLPLDDDDESKADDLDGAIGEWSQFHETHGFYVQGVGQRTAVLPAGWAERLVAVPGDGAGVRTGLCLDPHDLCIAKLVANRAKDRSYCGALLSAGVVSSTTIRERLAGTDVPDSVRARITAWLEQRDLD